MKKIVIIDGQGGRMGKGILEQLHQGTVQLLFFLFHAAPSGWDLQRQQNLPAVKSPTLPVPNAPAFGAL